MLTVETVERQLERAPEIEMFVPLQCNNQHYRAYVGSHGHLSVSLSAPATTEAANQIALTTARMYITACRRREIKLCISAAVCARNLPSPRNHCHTLQPTVRCIGIATLHRKLTRL